MNPLYFLIGLFDGASVSIPSVVTPPITDFTVDFVFTHNLTTDFPYIHNFTTDME